MFAIASIEYELVGDKNKPTLVLLHGFSIDMYLYDAFMPYATEQFQVLRFLQPRMGQSPAYSSYPWIINVCDCL